MQEMAELKNSLINKVHITMYKYINVSTYIHIYIHMLIQYMCTYICMYIYIDHDTSHARDGRVEE
jgi:hypothetical protein